jgi:hypothetical protein
VRASSARSDRARRLYARSAAGEGQQCDVAGALDGFAKPALMPGTDAGHAAGQNLATLLDELRQNVGALVVDEVHSLDTELADFLLAEVLTLAAARSTGAATRTTRSTFTAWTAMSSARSTVTTAGTVSATFAARGAAWGGCLFLFL